MWRWVGHLPEQAWKAAGAAAVEERACGVHMEAVLS